MRARVRTSLQRLITLPPLGGDPPAIFPDIPSLGQVFADYTVAVETHALLLIGYAMFEMLGGNER
jgi:hypothetical protein